MNGSGPLSGPNLWGCPRELFDDQGKIVWKVRYNTYGNVAVKEVEEVESNLRFQNQYFDEETGLHYSRFQYYNPNTGQFITQDPIGLLGGLITTNMRRIRWGGWIRLG